MNITTRIAKAAALAGAILFPAAAGAEELVVGAFGGSFADNAKACYVEPFEKATGATVTLKLANSSQHAAAVRATAGESDMDVVFMDDAFAAQLKNEGLTEKLDRSKLTHADEIVPDAWGADDAYVVAMLSATTIVYNPQTVTTPPTSWKDLFDPKYAGRVTIGDISGTTGWQFLMAVNKMEGGSLEDITPGLKAIKPLAENSVVLYTQADQVVSLFERGEVDIAVWYPDRAGVAAQKGLPVAVAYPQEGAVAIKPSVVMPKGTQKSELALKFIDTVLSAESQKCFSEAAFIGSVNKNVKLSDEASKIVPTGEVVEKLLFLDPNTMSQKLPEWTRQWQREVAR